MTLSSLLMVFPFVVVEKKSDKIVNQFTVFRSILWYLHDLQGFLSNGKP